MRQCSNRENRKPARPLAGLVLACWVCAFLGLATGELAAGENGNHYPNGVEGIKAASVPPPGVYLRWYNFYYGAGEINGGGGEALPIGFDVGVWATAPRVVWITKHKFLGAYVGFDVMLPIIRTGLNIDALRYDGSTLGLGDFYFSPLILSWHGKRYDAALAYSLFVPTGKWSRGDPCSAGKNYWTHMITAGGTVYLDQEKKWSASVLGRYEIHSGRRDEDVKLGQDFHCEWGVARTVRKTIDVGVVGYCQFQVTKDRGHDVTWDPDVKDRAFAVGPEVCIFFPKAVCFLSIRGLFEFGVRDRSQGHMIVVTLTKRF